MLVATLALNDGHSVPWLAFGTGSAFYGKDATKAVTVAIRNGFTHLDGAQAYQNEETLGAGIIASGKPRSELYITTKYTPLVPGETPKSALEKSLKKLRVTYVDLYLVHHPKHHAGKLKEVWKGLEETKKAGLARSIGVSNFTADHLEEIFQVATIIPAVNQVEGHPYVWKALESTLAVHQKYGIMTAIYGGLSPITCGKGGPLDPVIEKIRVRLEDTWGSPVTEGQVLQKWLQQKGTIVVTTSSKAGRMIEYLDTENVPELTPEEMELIETTGAKLHMRTCPRNWPTERVKASLVIDDDRKDA